MRVITNYKHNKPTLLKFKAVNLFFSLPAPYHKFPKVKRSEVQHHFYNNVTHDARMNGRTFSKQKKHYQKFCMRIFSFFFQIMIASFLSLNHNTWQINCTHTINWLLLPNWRQTREIGAPVNDQQQHFVLFFFHVFYTNLSEALMKTRFHMVKL